MSDELDKLFEEHYGELAHSKCGDECGDKGYYKDFIKAIEAYISKREYLARVDELKKMRQYEKLNIGENNG